MGNAHLTICGESALREGFPTAGDCVRAASPKEIPGGSNHLKSAVS